MTESIESQRVEWLLPLKGFFSGAVRKVFVGIVRKSVTMPIIFSPMTGLYVTRDVALAAPSIIFGRYERSVSRAILSVGRPIRVAYDVGAHIGLTTLVLAKAFGRNARIIAFEPLRENVAKLEELLSANPCVNATLKPFALAEQNGESKCFHRSSSRGVLDTIATRDRAHVKGSDFEIVRTVTLDSFVRDGHPPPEFMKIDVEGAEDLVITGGMGTIERYHPILLIELHGPTHAANVFELLSNQRYQWVYLHPKLGPNERIMDRAQLLAYFGPDDRWTQHVLLQ